MAQNGYIGMLYALTPIEPETKASSRNGENESMKIIIVDDDTTVLKALGTGLARLGCDVLAARTPAQALQVIESSLKANTPVGALVTDLVMPGTDGLDLIQSAREIIAGLPVVLMTGHASPYVQKKIAAMGIGDYTYVEKPFNLQFLYSKIVELQSRQPDGVSH